MNPLRLVLVDDHQLFRDALRCILLRHADLRVVGEAGDAQAAYEVVDATAPDVAIVDVSLPGVNGVAVVRELLRRARDRRTLMLTMHAEEEFVVQAISAGACGYALKHQPPHQIVDAVREVGQGNVYLAPRVSRFIVDQYLRLQDGKLPALSPLSQLSPREREVFDLLVRGYSNEGAAGHLTISVKTVETHRAHILKKLRVHSIVELVHFATRHRLLSDLDHAGGS